MDIPGDMFHGQIKKSIYYHKYSFNKKTTNYSKEYKPGFIVIDSWLSTGLRKEAWINIDRTNLNVKWQNRISGWHNIYNPGNLNNKTFNQNINSTYMNSQSGSPATRLFNWDRLNEFHYVESKILEFFYEEDNTYEPDLYANLICEIERKNESEITSYFKKVSNILNQEIEADIKKIKDTISKMKPKTLL